MICGFGSPQELAACISYIRPLIELIVALTGLGTLALVTTLLWLIRKLRTDLTSFEKRAEQAERENSLAQQLAASERSRADTTSTRVTELQKIIETSTDELHQKLADIQNKFSILNGKFGTALDVTSRHTSGFWSRNAERRFDTKISNSIPILLFANQKGGVGKTTLVANLAACFVEKGERVLAIDLDYQGSLSTLMQRQSEIQDEQSLVDHLFESALDKNWMTLAIRSVSDRQSTLFKLENKLSYIPALYSFEALERELEYRWTLGETGDDVRYRLARALHSESLQNRFDRILLDAPPRFTLGFINGFCAATHLYVPTVVDAVSVKAVDHFAKQFNQLKPIINPMLQFKSIIGNMVSVANNNPLELPQTAESFAKSADDAVKYTLNTSETYFVRNAVIRRDQDIAKATESGLSVLQDEGARTIFENLANVIISQVPMRSRHENTSNAAFFARAG